MLAPSDVLLSDGSIAVVRPMTAEDHDALVSLHDGVEDESVRRRFFTLNRDAGRSYVEHLVAASGDSTIALVATEQGRLVAVATAEVVSSDSAEVAFLVSDAARGLGLGSLLLEHIAAACRGRGVRRLLAQVLTENTPMMNVFRDAGFALTRHSDLGVAEFEIGTDLSSDAIRAADHRESLSEARSLAPLLQPKTVAIVGVRRDGTGIGHSILDAVIQGDFTGRTYVVHPSADLIDGMTAHASLAVAPTPQARLATSVRMS